jgi:hypothetical protein
MHSANYRTAFAHPMLLQQQSSQILTTHSTAENSSNSASVNQVNQLFKTAIGYYIHFIPMGKQNYYFYKSKSYAFTLNSLLKGNLFLHQ